MLWRSVLSVSCMLVIVSAAYAQTIHKDDLDYFVGAFAKVDSAGKGIIDCSRFVEWRLIKPDSTGQRNYERIKYSDTLHWVYDSRPITDQGGEVRWHSRPQFRNPSLSGYLFYIFQDFSGWEWQRNILTVWEPTGMDSVRFVCGQPEEFYTGIGRAIVKLVTFFPDSSLMLVADLSGEGAGLYGFYRSRGPCNFGLFHMCKWKSPDDEDTRWENVTFDLESLTEVGMSYRIFERWEYISTLLAEAEGANPRIAADSIVYKDIDLWSLARQQDSASTDTASPTSPRK